MAEKILFVDDEPIVLDGYKRALYKEFEIDTALGGEKGLEAIEKNGGYAVVISDMRMPEMNGVQFLTKVRKVIPDAVRMILTGYTDMSDAINAVNEGHIFRFLTKPCDKETLGKAITTGLVQYRLVTAEKELLENTLMGSIRVLTDVLSAANPAAFGKAQRIKRYVQHIVRKLDLSSPWMFDVAAMLSQLGCIGLDPEIVEAAYMGNELSPDDKKRFDAHPETGAALLANIPRLEPVAWLVSHQNKRDLAANDVPHPASVSSDALTTGAKILALAVALDDLRMRGQSEEDAISKLRFNPAEWDPRLLDALNGLPPDSAKKELRTVSISKLCVGAILLKEVRTHTGLLVVAKGQEVNRPLLTRLESFVERDAIDSTVLALMPV
jgi:response regulator RpfG family c-di-GMP phosphodiesterase